MTIEEQVRAAQLGDDEAFHALISMDRERLYRIAYAYLRNEIEALEALQETTCRAYMKLRKLKEPRYFHTWLIRILINYCIDEQKRCRKTMPLTHPAEQPVHETPALDAKLDMELAIERLPPKYRHVIILKYYQDMTLTDIAELLEKPEGTVKTWLHKALKQLKGDFGKEEYEYV
ncbi:sigma-70 family RNA polymerase sigma factor [Paenibacillus chartarius]|uniref:Sigma-70 family RNA polymerase sigma factor n=1 Tax=Paenibacillus chartarius TaxID=747481 RepID=A0ABV6DSJ5_9BACL